jgi:multidrug efflux pump subunit AcrA (membrane-fusion protein)
MLIQSLPAGETALFMKRLHLERLWLPSLVILPFLHGCAEKKAPPMMREVVPISVAEVVTRDVPVQVSAIGTVEALSTVSVKSQVNGEIREVHFKEGQEVKKGDLLPRQCRPDRPGRLSSS